MENELTWHGLIVDQKSLPSVEDFLKINGLDWLIGKTMLPSSLVKNEDILVDGVNIFDI